MPKAKTDEIETRRLALQAECDAGKSKEERNRLGQFATPTALAREIVSYGLTLLPKGAPVRFFDPAIGTGSFYAALCHSAGKRKVEKAWGYEIDPHYADPARAFWKETPLEIVKGDFTAAKPPAGAREKANFLICNPPYVRHHHLSGEDKARLQLAAERVAGLRLSGLTGLYCYFLVLSHAWMDEGGIAAWLIPSEFMDVNYGQEIKRYLLDKVTLLRIHRFDPADVQFEDALVSSAVVWYRKELPPVGHQVEFSYGGTHAAPKISKHVGADILRDEAKWTRFPKNGARENEGIARIADLFSIKRGLATGDNSFFMLPPERIAELELPMSQFRPILPSPRYVPTDEIPADANGDPLLEKRLYLLDCRLSEEQVRAQFPALWRYFESGRGTVARTYLCSKRSPWYAQESREPSPFLCTYMGRGKAGEEKPFRFVLNHSRAVAANTWLNIYPRPVIASRLAADPALTRKVWEALRRIAPASMLEEGRVYGGGLHKMEPKELSQVPAGEIAELLGIKAETQRDLFRHAA